MDADHLAVRLAVTIRHDGHGGVADDLADTAGLTQWAREHATALVPGGYRADAATLTAVVAVRTAVRALFARAVLPGAPSRADAGRLPDPAAALATLNDTAGRVALVPRLDWPAAGPARAGFTPAGAADPGERLAAGLAHAAIAFLGGPDRDRLRACPAPRCVRYFVQDHPRQEWCKPACGNRARVARHHARQRAQGSA